MIQSTRGISKPRAATSVQRSVPDSALQNSKNVVVRFCCFCFPYEPTSVRAQQENLGRTYVKVKYWYINIVKEFGMVLYRITAREENNHFLLHVLPQEAEEQEESSVRGAYDVAL